MRRLGVIYNLIHKRIKTIREPHTFIWRKDLFVILGRVYHVEKPMRQTVMREMIDNKMLKVIKQDFLEILD